MPVKAAKRAPAATLQGATQTPLTVKAFPVAQAQQLAARARAARKSGEVRGSFSIRKLLLWQQATLILQAEGWEYAQAVASGFHLAVLAKTYGEERTLLLNLYQSIFAQEARLYTPTTADSESHPMEALLLPIVRQSMPLWLHGSNGTGKSYTAERLARQLGRTYYRAQGTGDMTVDDLLGGFAAKDGATFFEYGPLPRAMREGAVLNIDEISAIRPEVLFELHAVLEGHPLVLKKNRGETVEAVEGFTLIASDNSVGLAETTEFVGLAVTNEAFRDRWLFAEFRHMPESMERAALTRRAEAWVGDRGWTLDTEDAVIGPRPVAPPTPVRDAQELARDLQALAKTLGS